MAGAVFTLTIKEGRVNTYAAIASFEKRYFVYIFSYVLVKDGADVIKKTNMNVCEKSKTYRYVVIWKGKRGRY